MPQPIKVEVGGMNKILLEIGCEGGSIKINSILLHDKFFYQVKVVECFDGAVPYSNLYLKLEDAWRGLKNKYPLWPTFYLDSISAQMIDMLKEDYLLSINKDDFTKQRWLEQLIGKGLGF